MQHKYWYSLEIVFAKSNYNFYLNKCKVAKNNHMSFQLHDLNFIEMRCNDIS